MAIDMAQQEELVLWIDRRWKNAIEKHLNSETLQEHLEMELIFTSIDPTFHPLTKHTYGISKECLYYFRYSGNSCYIILC